MWVVAAEGGALGAEEVEGSVAWSVEWFLDEECGLGDRMTLEVFLLAVVPSLSGGMYVECDKCGRPDG